MLPWVPKGSTVLDQGGTGGDGPRVYNPAYFYPFVHCVHTIVEIIHINSSELRRKHANGVSVDGNSNFPSVGAHAQLDQQVPGMLVADLEARKLFNLVSNEDSKGLLGYLKAYEPA